MAPSIDIEHILSVIWAELLNIEAEKLGITDNFSSLGGNSFLSIQVVSRGLQASLKLTIEQVFEYHSIQYLSPHVSINI